MSSESTKSKQKKKHNYIFFIKIGIGLVLGFCLGIILDKIINMNGSFQNTIVSLLLFVVLLCLAVYLQIIVHESGHFVFGKLCGYEFVSFRIGSFILTTENGKYKIKRLQLKGTGGQCLMMPPREREGYEIPYKLYNLGGVLANLIISLFSIIIIIFIHSNAFVTLFFEILCIIGLLYVVTNGIPMKLNGIANDGYNLITISKDKDARFAFYLMLKVNALISEGKRLKDLPTEWFELKQDFDYSNPLICTLGALRCSYLQDMKLFDEAKELCEFLINNASGMLEIHKKELYCDLLFYEIVGQCRVEEIENIYTTELKKYIKMTSSFISKNRLIYAYELLVNHNGDKAKKQLQALEKRVKTYPYLGEIEGERELINLVTEKAVERKIDSYAN